MEVIWSWGTGLQLHDNTATAHKLGMKFFFNIEALQPYFSKNFKVHLVFEKQQSKAITHLLTNTISYIDSAHLLMATIQNKPKRPGHLQQSRWVNIRHNIQNMTHICCTDLAQSISPNKVIVSSSNNTSFVDLVVWKRQLQTKRVGEGRIEDDSNGYV